MKCALILFTGDRIEYIDQSIFSCKKIIESINSEIDIDIFIISFEGTIIHSKNDFKHLSFKKPDNENIDNFPNSIQQLKNYSSDIETNRRISFGHYILCGSVPDIIHQNRDLFLKYDLILKSRTDLIFDFNQNYLKNFNPEKEILTFECFWGGCRYNSNFTNDHFIFGDAHSVLQIISYPISNCLLNHFWNPEHYMTHLYSLISKIKIQITTDKYYLLSKDRPSRKFIGFPLEKVNRADLDFLSSIGIDTSEINFVNDYE
jgi:hypothetical protein